MAGSTFASVDAYIAAQPGARRPTLERVRRIIREAVPNADESMSYNMPTYKIAGAPCVQFASWKDHYALYLSTEPIVSRFKSELSAYKVDKGTIRFAFSDPVPEQLIRRIVEFRGARAQ